MSAGTASAIPDRLVGDEIPIGARVFAVADTLDALTNDRPYRAAGSWEDAAALIVAEAGRAVRPRRSRGFSRAGTRHALLAARVRSLAALN